MKLFSVQALLFALFLSFSADRNLFEGEITYLIQNPESALGETAHLSLTFNNNRIFVDSNVSMNVMAGLSARGVLVRNDLQDFVLITDEKEGLKVAKTELDNLVTLMNRIQGRQEAVEKVPFAWDEKVTETGQTRQLHGYTTYEFQLKGDADGEYISVWLTDAIKVDWGLLLEAWYTTGTVQFDHEIPVEMVMNSNSFPLLVEVYRGGTQVMKAEAQTVNRSGFDRSKTSLSSDFKLLGITDLMMNFFRQQR